MSQWVEVKAFLPGTPEDWSAWCAVFESEDVNGTVQTEDPPTLSGFVSSEETDRIERLVVALEDFGAKEVHQTTIEETDWAEAWKQFFKPRRIGERLVVKPTWEPYDVQPGDLVIELDPGQSFGTGDHPTTRGCLELMEKAAIDDKDVADIGCGSGILTVAAGLLGARTLVGVDIEQVSVQSARENLERNGLTADLYAGKGFDPLVEDQTFDIVLSNIISAALVNLAPEAVRRVRQGGLWIVSGIIHDNWPEVRTRAERCGFTLGELFSEGDWVAATFHR